MAMHAPPLPFSVCSFFLGEAEAAAALDATEMVGTMKLFVLPLVVVFLLLDPL
jgi:hypothetical protein